MLRNFIIQKRFLQTASRYLPADILLNEIEKITDGNIFKNLDWLLSDDANNMADYFKSLAGTSHPVVNTIRDFIENKSVSFGMVLNLFSEVANCGKSPHTKNKQMVLAKVTEMLRMATFFHNGVIPVAEEDKELHKGNKISILCGDFLLSKCLTELSKLREQFYVEYMSSALRDLTLGKTLGPMDKNGKIYPLKPTKSKDVSILDDFTSELSDYSKLFGCPLSEWMFRSSLNGGNLLGKGSYSILRVAKYTEGLQNIGFSFGKYFALVLKAHEDIYDILKQETFDLVNLVVYLHMKKYPKFYREIEKHKNDLNAVDYKYIVWKLVEDGSLEESLEFKSTLITSCMNTLEVFEDSDAKSVIKELVKSLEY